MKADSDGHLQPVVDAKGLRQALDPKVGGVLVEPKDAQVVLANGKPKIIPSKDGRTLEAAGLSAALLKVLPQSGARTASVALATSPATFSTADAKALGIKEVVSTFTQHFPYAPYRVQNIGRAAKYINGTLLKPGDTFSMNGTVKERTVANGYTVGTVITQGRFREDLGGGVSTITTAMWHTAFYAGVQRVEQRAHSFYISRYLPGLEATVAWGNLDLKFKNDAPTGILIATHVTNSSVTITMWGTKRYDVDAIFGPRTNVRAFDTIYDPGAGCVHQDGVAGFAITVVRVFKDLHGNVVKREPLTHPLQPGGPHHLRAQAGREAGARRRRVPPAAARQGSPPPSPAANPARRVPSPAARPPSTSGLGPPFSRVILRDVSATRLTADTSLKITPALGDVRATLGVYRPLRVPTGPGVRDTGLRCSVRRLVTQAPCSSFGGVVTYVIALPCVDLLDKACIEECPVDCIYEGERMLYIHPDECVDCGACEPVCPVEAIFYEDDTPEEWKDFYKANVEFFDELGSPGGASKLGKINKDHPLVAALPPQEHEGH